MPFTKVISFVKSVFFQVLNIGTGQARDKRELRRIRMLNACLIYMVPHSFIMLGIGYVERDAIEIRYSLLIIFSFIFFLINTRNYKISRMGLMVLLISQRVAASYMATGQQGEYFFLGYSLVAMALFPAKGARYFFVVNFICLLVAFYLDEAYPVGAVVLLIVFYLTGIVLFHIYIQETESYAKQIEEQTRQLKEADELKTRFFINVSHEFRTPVTIVSGIIENIRSGMYGPIPYTIKEKLKRADIGASRLLQLVNNMLDLTRLEKGAMQLNEKPVHLYQLINRQADIFRTLANSRNVEVQVMHENLPKTFLLDEEKFESIISNLLSNALKFTPAGGKIAIETGEDKNHFFIKIKDTGTGISSRDLPYIFDRFYQARNKKMQGGTGVGLALVKELISLHDGSVSVESVEGKGSVFTLLLPVSRITGQGAMLYPEKSDGEVLIRQVGKVKKHSGKSILIVEDNEEMGEYLQDLLLNENYQAEWVPGGTIGLEKLRETVYDMIITDYMMPDMDGKEFTEHVKSSEKSKNIPLIFLTARNEKEGKLDVLRLGVDDYILKPFHREELLLKISNLLHNAENRRKFLLETGLEAEPPEDERFLSEVRSLVDRNMNNSRYKLSDLAEDLNITERQLFRKIKACTGMTPNNLIKEIKLQYARQLFEQKSFSTIKEVASRTGYENSAHFAKIFEEKFGRHPATYFLDNR